MRQNTTHSVRALALVRVLSLLLPCVLLFGLVACASSEQMLSQSRRGDDFVSANDISLSAASSAGSDESLGNEAESVGGERDGRHASSSTGSASEQSGSGQESHSISAEAVRDTLDLSEDYRDSFDHGPKGAECQKYIVLHDTEGDGNASGVIGYWDSSGAGVGAHFIVNKDGSVVQCVPLDRIAHHAGYGDTGHNELYGISEDGRDDMVGTVPIGDWAADYGMNAWSIGIEMVHVGGSGYYPEEQLAALDALIAYIDAYYGFESTIIDHKAWRSGNSDTSPEFAEHLACYQSHRTHSS